MREKVGKSRNTVFFQWFGAPEGRKVGSLKAAGPAGQMRDEKVHAVLARSTFGSQNVQNTPGPDHFWKLRCRKSARRCGAKHISKSKCTKHYMFAPLWRDFWRFGCWKSRTSLWREAHFQVKMLKTPGFGPLLEFRCRKSADVASARSTSMYTTLPGHYTTLHSSTLHYTTLHYTTLQLQLHNYTPLH